VPAKGTHPVGPVLEAVDVLEVLDVLDWVEELDELEEDVDEPGVGSESGATLPLAPHASGLTRTPRRKESVERMVSLGCGGR
jgi:hypothetical protein